MQDSTTNSLAAAAVSAAPVAYRYRFADAEYDEAAGTLRVAGSDVAVEPVPLHVLRELLRRPNEVVTRRDLLDTVWQGRVTVDHVVTSAVNKLREALGKQAAARLVTVPRIGYRLIGPLERVATGRRLVSSVDLKAGAEVPGRTGYRLVRPLGDRPDGTVWLACESRLEISRVFKFAFDGERLSALKREYTVCRFLRRELGERPDFVPMLSASFSLAPYFLEYEFAGTDLPSWAAEGERLTTLTTHERLALFLQIARAVCAAHAVGVLHKDLKPANILVGGSAGAWQARLTDFGSSRLLEPGRLAELGVTAMGLTMADGVDASSPGGTLLYLAPELLAGQSPTTGSDLYALGLLLYQLLVGDFRRPMSTGWQRDIADELLAEDLAAATEGRPEARLGSVAAFVDRLSTLDERRTERALLAQKLRRAEEVATQLRQSRARRPWVAAAISGLALGLAASLWFYSRAGVALHKAEQESARAQAINDFLTRDVLQSADVLRSVTSKTVSMQDVLRRASERAAERFKGQARTEASVRRQLGDIYLHMHYLTQADQQFARAVELLEPVAPADDPELLAARFGLARTSVGIFRPAEALKKLEFAERAAGAQALGGADELALLAARARVEVMMDAQQHSDALPIALRLMALSDQLAGADIGARFEARQLLSELYLRLGDKPRADALLTEIMNPPYGENNVGEVLYARTKLRIGRDRINEGRLEEAETLLTEVRDTMTRAFGPTELYAGGANLELADLHLNRGHLTQAAQAAKAALAAFSASLGEDHSYTIIAKVNLGAIEVVVGEPASALRRLDEVRPRAQAMKDNAPLVTGIDFARAKALTDLGQPGQALAILQGVNAELLAESSWGPRDFQWQLQAEKGRAMMALNQRQQGLALVRTAAAEMAKLNSYPWLQQRYAQVLRGPTQVAHR
jgi:eukaryotic-like serine/threonine-protein kinase